MSETSQEETQDSQNHEINDDSLDAILRDPTTKARLLQKMGLEDGGDRTSPGKGLENVPCASHANLTLSGKSAGSWPPAANWFASFPGFPVTGPNPVPPGFYPIPGHYGCFPIQPSSSEMQCTSAQAASSGTDGSGDTHLAENSDSEDAIQLLDEAEALELVEFDPGVDSKDAWDPPKPMTSFLEKHFNRSLSDAEREAIMKDFPKPNCPVMSAPKLDEQVKDQLKRKGKDPHFGAEKSLYKIQDQLLDVAGPLACLWADLLNKEAKVSREDTLLLLQRALVLLGSTSHAITLERRKVAWSRINPSLKALATEEYEKRETSLFGPGFLEKASRRLEAEKTLSKVASQGNKGGPPSKKARYENDKSDLRSFLAKGAPAMYGGRRPQRRQPYSSYTRFQSTRYNTGRPPKPQSQSTPSTKGKFSQ